MSHNARAIYQANLDAVSRAVWEQDIDAALAHLELPNRMATQDTEFILVDAAELLRAIANLRESLTRLGATGFHRICQDAVVDPSRPDRIIGRHRSYVLRGGSHVLPPYESQMSLVQTAAGWKANDIYSEVNNRDMTVVGHDGAPFTGASQRRN